jgi:Zn-dependent protease
MLLFQQPPPTRYDLRFSIAGIPIRVHPLFWLIAVLFGSSGDLLLLPIWVLVIFVSILAHELGHALAFRRYGQRSQIVLHFAGGLTIPEPVSWGSGYANVGLTANQQIFISLSGPGAGFLFAGLVVAIVLVTGGSVGINWLLGFIPILDAVMPFGGRVVAVLISMLLWVNVFWGLINLVPVYPLDGGSVARNAFLQADPIDGIRKSLWLSVIAGGIVAVAGLLFFRSIFMALLFGFLAFQSYQSLQHRF